MTAADLPAPPALIIQAQADERLDWVRELNGEPVLLAGETSVYLAGIRWADNAGLPGWYECAGGYWRPDLRTVAGQAWQRRLNALRWPVAPEMFRKTFAEKK